MKPIKVRNEGLWREMGIRARNVTGKLARAGLRPLIFFSGAPVDPEQFPDVTDYPATSQANVDDIMNVTKGPTE